MNVILYSTGIKKYVDKLMAPLFVAVGEYRDRNS